MPTDDEWRPLIPQIDQIARRVANRCNASQMVRTELADEAVGHMFSVYEKFNPAIASFSAWADRVLRNLCISLIRREAVRRKLTDSFREFLSQKGQASQPVGPAELSESGSADQASHESLLSNGDIEALLEKLPSAQDRLLLGAYQGILSVCDAEAVDRWCRDSGLDHAGPLRALEQLPRQQRKQALAHIFGATVDWVRQRIFRAVQRLKTDGQGGDQA